MEATKGQAILLAVITTLDWSERTFPGGHQLGDELDPGADTILASVDRAHEPLVLPSAVALGSAQRLAENGYAVVVGGPRAECVVSTLGEDSEESGELKGGA